MLLAGRRKIAYIVMAVAAALMLLSTPVVVPSAHADCSPASSCNSGG
mgnify:CR=1 FL=1